MDTTFEDRCEAREALRRGAKVGQPIPPCSCFAEGGTKRECVGVCEDAVDWVARAIAAAHAAKER